MFPSKPTRGLADSASPVILAPGQTDALRFGLPSKGRLQQQTASFLSELGIDLVRSDVDREYAGSLVGIEDVELVFLQAGEMPQKLARGEIHLAVTGEDLIQERAPSWRSQIRLLKKLDFGHATLVVAIPKCWIDVSTLDDLDDVAADFRRRHGHPLRVATKYLSLARRFFREAGVANITLVESQGATEGLVAAGAAEAVVDITSSGETLRANHLKILDNGVLMHSQAHLCASLTAPWTSTALEAVRTVLERLGGQSDTRDVEIRVRIDRIDIDRADAALSRIGARLSQRPLKGFPGQALVSAPRDVLGLAIDILIAAGATAVEASPHEGEGGGFGSAPPSPAKPTLYDLFVRQLEASRNR